MSGGCVKSARGALRQAPVLQRPQNVSFLIHACRFRRHYSGKLVKRESAADSVLRPGNGSAHSVPRVSYEYPPPPRYPKPPRQSSAYRRHLPMLAGVAGIVWAVYAYNYMFNSNGEEQAVLTPDRFVSFRVTYKENLTQDLMLIEIAPKLAAHLDLLKSDGGLWNGKKLWSLEVKHPEIQIARRYTPLPLYYMQSVDADGDRRGLLRMLGSDKDEGRLVLMVKRYADGEMSRYLHALPVGSDIEIRGPFIEHAFPYSQADMQPQRSSMLDVPSRVPANPLWDPAFSKPDNIAFFTGGTGIAPALQALLSPNPPRGYTTVFHSVRTRSDVPFQRFMLFLEKTGRARFNIFVDDENSFITARDVPEPVPVQPRNKANQSIPAHYAEGRTAQVKYQSAIQQFGDKTAKWPYVPGYAYAVICGPSGYVNYMAGDPGDKGQAPIGGVLGNRGWTLENAKRMSDW